VYLESRKNARREVQPAFEVAVAAKDKAKVSGEPITLQDEGAISCLCELTMEDEMMIECEQCNTWLHICCVGISQDSLPDHFICASCEGLPKPHFVIQWPYGFSERNRIKPGEFKRALEEPLDPEFLETLISKNFDYVRRPFLLLSPYLTSSHLPSPPFLQAVSYSKHHLDVPFLLPGPEFANLTGKISNLESQETVSLQLELLLTQLQRRIEGTTHPKELQHLATEVRVLERAIESLASWREA